MDTKTLISDAKARFSHNSAKSYLKDKYASKLIIADQGGLWTATTSLIAFLGNVTSDKVVIIDNFENPVEVNRAELLYKLNSTYTEVMGKWHAEWASLEGKR